MPIFTQVCHIITQRGSALHIQPHRDLYLGMQMPADPIRREHLRGVAAGRHARRAAARARLLRRLRARRARLRPAFRSCMHRLHILRIACLGSPAPSASRMPSVYFYTRPNSAYAQEDMA